MQKQINNANTNEGKKRILGKIIFKLVEIEISKDNIEHVPKITGMLVDFEVFEEQEIIEFIYNKAYRSENIEQAL